MRDQPPEPPDDAAAMTPAASWLPMTQASSSRALQAAGLVFAVLFFVQISVIALPLSLSDPGQLLSVISEAITLSSMLLLSMLFLFIAEAIQPADANYDWEPQIHRNRYKNRMKLACICIGLIYMMLVPAIVALSLDLRSVGLRQLDNLRRSQESYLASATLNIAQSAHSPGALGTARQQIRDYMIRFDINSPGLDTESVADPNQLLNLVKAFQGNAMEQYLNKRFIADNDLIRRSLRNTMGTVLYSCFFLYLSRFWVESDSERM